MRFRRCAQWALVGFFALAAPMPVFAQASTLKVEDLKPGSGEVEPHAEGFVHRASGYIFPRALGEIPARKSTTYGPADADVYYTLYGGGNGDGWINLYVYPATIPFEAEVASTAEQTAKSTSGNRVSPPAQIGKRPESTKEQWFQGSVQGVDLVAGFRIARVGDWFIKARMSVPSSADEKTLNRLGAALRAINFTPAGLVPRVALPLKEATPQ